MSDVLANLLIGGAGAGRGYLDEKKRREQLAMDQRKLVMQEKAAEAETALRQAQLQSEDAYRRAQANHLQTEDTALYGDVPVTGGLRKYGIDAVGDRQEDVRDFLLNHPDFETGTSRMTPRDKTPYNPYTKYSPLGGGASGGAGADPMDVARYRLDYIKGIVQSPQGVIPPPFSIRAAQADSLANELGIGNLLRGELTFPEKTKGNVSLADSTKTGKKKPPVMLKTLQMKMIDEVNASTDDPAALMRELEADVKANPAAFKGVDLNAVRAAIKAKGRKK